MYVCICNSITDKDIKHAIKNGAKSVKDLNKQLNLGSNCGTCVPSAQAIIDVSNQSQEFNIPIYKPSFG